MTSFGLSLYGNESQYLGKKFNSDLTKGDFNNIGFVFSSKWTWFAIGYQCGFAYLIALMINQFGNAFTGSLNVIGLIAAIVVLAGMIYMLFKPYKEATKLSDKR